MRKRCPQCGIVRSTDPRRNVCQACSNANKTPVARIVEVKVYRYQCPYCLRGCAHRSTRSYHIKRCPDRVL